MNGNEDARPEAIEVMQPVTLKFAPAWKRVVSFIIDKIILYIIFSILIYIVYQKQIQMMSNLLEQAIAEGKDSLKYFGKLIADFSENLGFQISLAHFIIEASYFSLGWMGNGQTPGARIMKIVVMTVEKKKLSFFMGVVRYSLLSLFSLVFYLPLIFIYNSVYQQRLHDYVTASVVVEMPKAKEMPTKNSEKKEKDEEIS